MSLPSYKSTASIYSGFYSTIIINPHAININQTEKKNHKMKVRKYKRRKRSAGEKEMKSEREKVRAWEVKVRK